LKEKPQIVLYGPPGTGKTFVAQAIASELLENNGGFDEERVTLVQFHPSYGYEDFVEGLRPVSKANGIVFETVAGEIVKLSKLIQNDGQPRVLIIDEINRANIPRVFGELMYLLEYRDKKINLMLHDGFMLPKDLYVIATMNTADKSTRVMDSALRRRFDFFSLEPDVIVLKKYYADSANHNEIGEELFEGFVALNSALLTDLDRHRLIGHSYFMKDVFSLQTLRARWERQIAPLIEEYFFDRDTYGTSYTVERFWPSAKT
jgi:5-methylcytosine-specific restriction protein B